MQDCKDEVEVTMRASVLNVTPEDDAAETAEEVIEAANVVSETDTAPEDAVEMAEAEPEAETVDPELVAAGEKVFGKCKACHQVGDGAKNRVGPVLNGIVGADIAAVDGFRYSKVLEDMDGEWTEEALAAFLADPRGFAKGTKMSFAGLRKEDEIAAVTAYLSTFE